MEVFKKFWVEYNRWYQFMEMELEIMVSIWLIFQDFCLERSHLYLIGFKCNRSPIKNDLNIEFSGFFKSGISFKFIPIDFSFYRDNGLQIIGEKGITILNDSRIMFLNKTRKNRGISNLMKLTFQK